MRLLWGSAWGANHGPCGVLMRGRCGFPWARLPRSHGGGCSRHESVSTAAVDPCHRHQPGQPRHGRDQSQRRQCRKRVAVDHQPVLLPQKRFQATGLSSVISAAKGSESAKRGYPWKNTPCNSNSIAPLSGPMMRSTLPAARAKPARASCRSNSTLISAALASAGSSTKSPSPAARWRKLAAAQRQRFGFMPAPPLRPACGQSTLPNADRD